MTSEMRVLTVRQPWAWAIIHGGKDVENRVRNIAGDYRGPVAIHVAKAIDDGYDRKLIGEAVGHWRRTHPGVSSRDSDDQRTSRPMWFGQRGAIIGVVDLVDVHRPLWDDTCADGAEGACSPWAEMDGWPYHLVLASARALAEPIPFRGALGLRRLDDDMVARVEEAIA